MKKIAKSIIEDLQGEDKERVMFYIDKELQGKFKKACMAKKIRMSAVIERLIQTFLEDIETK